MVSLICFVLVHFSVSIEKKMLPHVSSGKKMQSTDTFHGLIFSQITLPKMQFEQNPEDLTRKALDVESLGVLTSAFDLSQYVSTGNSITLQLTFKCFLFDRKFRITLWDLG